MYEMSVICRNLSFTDQSESQRLAGACADGQEVRHALSICERTSACVLLTLDTATSH